MHIPTQVELVDLSDENSFEIAVAPIAQLAGVGVAAVVSGPTGFAQQRRS